MAKFKLELKQKTRAEKLSMGATHITAMVGNTNYPVATRVPTDAQVQAVQDELTIADAEADAAEAVWKNKNAIRDAKEAAWDTVITARAGNCEAVTPNDLVALSSTGFPMRLPAGPMGELGIPGDLRATPAPNEGVIKLRCKTVKGASSYEWQVHPDSDAAWQPLQITTTTRLAAKDLTPGVLYHFRVRALGSAGAGPWSDVAIERAP